MVDVWWIWDPIAMLVSYAIASYGYILLKKSNFTLKFEPDKEEGETGPVKIVNVKGAVLLCTIPILVSFFFTGLYIVYTLVFYFLTVLAYNLPKSEKKGL